MGTKATPRAETYTRLIQLPVTAMLHAIAFTFFGLWCGLVLVTGVLWLFAFDFDNESGEDRSPQKLRAAAATALCGFSAPLIFGPLTAVALNFFFFFYDLFQTHRHYHSGYRAMDDEWATALCVLWGMGWLVRCYQIDNNSDTWRRDFTLYYVVGTCALILVALNLVPGLSIAALLDTP